MQWEIESEEGNYPPAPCETSTRNGFITKKGAQAPESRKPSIKSDVTARSTQSLQIHRKKPAVNFANAIAAAMTVNIK